MLLVLISVKRLSRPQGHSAIGRFMSMKNSNHTIWNRTSDLPICSTAQKKWVPEIFHGSKGGRCVRLTTLPPLCANCLEILGALNSWSPKSLSKRVMGYFGLYLRYYIYATSSKPSKHRLGFHALLWKDWLQSTAHVSQQTCNSSVIWKQLII